MDLNFIALVQNIFKLLISGMNDWGSLHPVVIHLPIALLFVAPFFIVVSLFFPNHRKSLLKTAFILMVIGTGFIFISTATGNAAAEHLEPDFATVKTLDAHVLLAERARLGFSLLTGVFFLYLWPLAAWREKWNALTNNILLGVLLAAYIAVLIVLLNAAHYGGTLVHHHKITSNLYNTP